MTKDDGNPNADFFTVQFAKSYYNIGVIHDRMGQILTACNSYKLALDKCKEDSRLLYSGICKKAGINYAVTLEKLGKRDKAFRRLEKMK